jgi:hypothetical protein
MVDEVLTQLSRRFETMYARLGRPSIASQLLQMLYCDSQRTIADGRDGLQPSVPLVCGAERGHEVWDATKKCARVEKAAMDILTGSTLQKNFDFTPWN